VKATVPGSASDFGSTPIELKSPDGWKGCEEIFASRVHKSWSSFRGCKT
jgi:hypothetical protein